MFSGSAMCERAPTLLKMVRTNASYMNLWFSHWLTDTLVWHHLQDWINPGYLERSEQRQKDLEGTHFMLVPGKVDRWVTGRRASPRAMGGFWVTR
ncbi:hypothetical protein MTX20_01390 (plasmid) [Bradyrhizobium sp. ISRA435]|nr:hypothetical protein MTX20_01390 [Bradyrhizobium sp. ISRA435]